MADTVTLENDTLRAIFSRQNGSLLGLTHKATGWPVQRRQENARSFQLQVPLPQRRNNMVLGASQNAPEVHAAADGKSVRFVWRKVLSEHGGRLDIDFTGTITLGDDGLRFDGEIENASDNVVECAYYPCLGDLARPDGCESFAHLNIGYGRLESHGIYPAFVNERGYHGFDRPIQLSAMPNTPFALMAAPDEGLYVGCHDTSMKEMVMFMLEQVPGVASWFGDRALAGLTIGDKVARVELNVVHFAYAQPGASTSLSPIVLNTYSGTWHKGADCYKAWRKTWFKPCPAPEWSKRVHSWHQIHINSPEDELRCRYTDLVKYGRECAKHGVAAIQLVGWNDGGQDRGNPSHEIDERLGTWQELRQAIEQIEAMGVRMIMFTKFLWGDRSQDWFRRELINYACTDPYGDYYVYQGYQYQTPAQVMDINTRRLIPMCMNSEWYRQMCNSQFRKAIALSASGMLYDECQHHGAGRYCFNPDHGHAVPAHTFAGDTLLERGFHEIADKEAPGFLFAGEACRDVQFQSYSLSYFRIWPGHVPGVRYVEPWQNLMVGVTGYNDRPMLNRCLLYRYVISYEPLNFKGGLDEFPLTIEYGKKIDALRTRYSDYLWDAEFRDTQHARVSVGGKEHKDFTVFRQVQTGKLAIVVANHDAAKAVEASVEVDGRAGKFVLVSPEQPEPQPATPLVRIEPDSLIVWLEQ